MVKIDDIESYYIKLFPSISSIYFNLNNNNKQEQQQEYKEEEYKEEGNNNNISLLLYKYIISLNYNIFQGEPILSIGIIITIILILRNKINNSILILICSILFNINPIYVIIIYIIYHLYINRFNKPKYKFILPSNNQMNNNINNNNNKKKRIQYNSNINLQDNYYDYILIGNSYNVNILIVAALLSRIGKKCCIIEPINESTSPSSILSSSQSIDLTPLKCFHPDRINRLFRLLFQETINFLPIGYAKEGYGHTIISFKMLNDKFEKILIRPGLKSFVEDFSLNTNCTSHQIECFKKLHQWCLTTASNIILYVHSTIDSNINWSSSFGGNSSKWISLFTGTTCSDLTHEIVEGSYISSSLRALSSWISGEFSCKLETFSSINLINVLTSSSLSGLFTIQGGYQLLCNKLIDVIQSYEGIIVTHVPIKQLLFKNTNNDEVIGVIIKINDTKDIHLKSKYGVISGISAISTFIQLIPNSITSSSIEKSRQKLKKLEVKRPKMYLIYHLKGAIESLELLNYEYLELHNNENDDNENNDDENNYINQSFKIWSPSVRDRTWSKNTQILIFEMEANNHIVKKFIEPKYEFTFYTPIPSNLNNTEVNKIINYGTKSITRIYPQIELINIEKIEFIPPIMNENNLSLTVQKYMSKITAKTDIKGLYLSGQDIMTTGFNSDVMSAISTTCAVLGYSSTELVSGRNIITDLEKTIKPLNQVKESKKDK